MRNILTAVIIVALVWYGYNKYQQQTADRTALQAPTSLRSEPALERASTFTCDGRTHCSQMTSCAEATYFIEHCPNTEMDGDNDGVPCESQWCN